MKLSAALAPGPRTLEYALHAESLGYERLWIYDSPGLYWECWPSLAQLAVKTTSIGLGVATLVPGMRHPVAAAGAALTIDQMGPGRLALSVGTGFTGRRLLGKRPHTWKTVEQYVATLRALLAGQETEIDGTIVRCLHEEGATRLGAAAIPILVAANGPKGIAAAHRGADGVISLSGAIPGFAWSASAVVGTVLNPGESYNDPAVIERIAAGIAVQYHVAYELGGPDSIDQLPGGEKWRLAIESIPSETRHLALHEGHATQPSQRERILLDPELAVNTFTGTHDQLRARAQELSQAGTTELIYSPLGPDIHRELHQMAAAVSIY